ncbi:alpha and gamma adaptin binding protein p34 [Colletotrichum tofieldiae]|nr:alpha and gamma adaptin binding protein p34 [Colletotrichum tofieldiae]
MGIPRVLEALESNDWDADDLDGGPSDLDSDADSTSGLPRKRRPLADGDGDDGDFDLDPESLDFGFNKSDFEADDDENGKKDARRRASGEEKAKETAEENRDGGDEELDGDEVEKIEWMMRKLQAVRDMTAGLPEEQRRKMAKKAVGEVMKEL